MQVRWSTLLGPTAMSAAVARHVLMALTVLKSSGNRFDAPHPLLLYPAQRVQQHWVQHALAYSTALEQTLL
jgi:hypothetical protein